MDSRVAFHSAYLNEPLDKLTSTACSESSAWVPISQASLGIDDWGLLQGAMLVERLRTVRGRPLDTGPHLDRLRSGAQTLGIAWPTYLDEALITQCAMRNQPAHAAEDFSIVVLLTPGSVHGPSPQPTVLLHTTNINWATLAAWYTHGQPLILADARNIPAECWSPHIKTRSRLHYFLADQQAQRSTLSPQASTPGAVMLSLAGHITETSVANLLVIKDDCLISPTLDSVLKGISLTRTLRLADALGIDVRYELITPSTALESDGILLTGSTGCLWPASSLSALSLGARSFQNANEHPVYATLKSAWQKEIGLDFVNQALGAANSVTPQ